MITVLPNSPAVRCALPRRWARDHRSFAAARHDQREMRSDDVADFQGAAGGRGRHRSDRRRRTVVRMLITEVLAELGYTAIEAADGSSALRVLQSDARIDLL